MPRVTCPDCQMDCAPHCGGTNKCNWYVCSRKHTTWINPATGKPREPRSKGV